MKLLSLWGFVALAVVQLCCAETHQVRVGLNHAFQPPVVNATVGDIIHFIFHPANHSVVRAEYMNPCIPYNYVHGGAPTFFSGNKESVETDDGNRPTWDLEVNSTEPIFFYCSAPGSCVDWHMVGAINPNATQTFDDQMAAAEDAVYQLSPGETAPNEDPNAAPSPTPSPQPSDSGDSSLSAGAIAGIAIGGAAVLIIAVALIYICGRKGGIEKGYRRSGVQPAAPPPVMEVSYADHAMGHDFPSKSPAPTSPFPASQASTYRSPSPAQWSSTVGSPRTGSASVVSPHTSWVGQPPQRVSEQYEGGLGAPPMESQELSASPYDPHFPGANPLNQHHAPVELPGDHATRYEAQ